MPLASKRRRVSSPASAAEKPRQEEEEGENIEEQEGNVEVVNEEQRDTVEGEAVVIMETGEVVEENRQLDPPQLQEDDILQDQLVQEFISETGCPVYSVERLKAEEVATLMLMPSLVDPDKVCCRIPPSCPGVGNWVFVISLDHVDSDDLSYDDLGKWNKPSGRRHYFGKTEDPNTIIKKSSVQDREPMDFDYCLRCNRYSHPGVGGNVNKFQKWTYLAFNKDNDLLGPYAVIIYQADLPPSSLRRLPHANSKTNERPLIRTKPSCIKQAKSLLVTHTPKQVMETMIAAHTIGGQHDVIDPSDLPKDTRQLSALAGRVSMAPRRGRGRPPKSGGTPRSDVYYSADVDSPTIAVSSPSRPATSTRLENMQMQLMQAERRKLETETEKLEMEKEKIKLEMQVLRAKKLKMDWEMSKEREGEVLIVGEGEGVQYEQQY